MKSEELLGWVLMPKLIGRPRKEKMLLISNFVKKGRRDAKKVNLREIFKFSPRIGISASHLSFHFGDIYAIIADMNKLYVI